MRKLLFWLLLLPGLASATDTFNILDKGITSGQVTTALGYTPVNKAGDSMTGALSMGSGFSYNWNNDLFLQRDAANALAQRNGTSPQSSYLYNTFTDASNYERLFIKWNGNLLQIGPEAAGTGTLRSLEITGTFFTSGVSITGANVNPRSGAGTTSLGTGGNGFAKLYIDYTNTATVGAVTINKAAGRVNLAAAAATMVVTDSLITAASHCFLNADSAPGNVVAVMLQAIPTAGSFTINAVPAVTNQTAIDFFCVNAD